jgi:hypothetical protein
MRRIKVSWEARCTKTKRNEVSCRACAASFPRRSRFLSLLLFVHPHQVRYGSGVFASVAAVESNSHG